MRIRNLVSLCPRRHGPRRHVALASLAILAFCWRSEAAHTPNIVVILSDDYGYGSATCYGARPDLIRTPNMDRLAKQGRRFTDANTTSSVCSPTRYSMLTGRYCWRTSLKHEVLGTTSPLHIEPGRLNLASLLKKLGYNTASIGKWHLGYGTDPRVDFTKELKPGPLEIGFDYHFGVPANHGDIAGVYVENHRVLGLRSDKLNREAAGKNFKGVPYLGLDAPHRVDEEGQFERQLYDLAADVGETSDVSAENQHVGEELAELLGRYRFGGYSRELPPPTPLIKPVAPLAEVKGKVVREESFEAIPDSPWVNVRGNWTARAGALRGSQKAGERAPAAMRCPLKLSDGDIQYELSLPFGTRHSLRLQGSQPDHVFVVQVSHRFLSITRQPTKEEPAGNIVMATEKMRLNPDSWAKVRIHFQGDELAAQVDETVVRTSHFTLANSKPAFALLASGRAAGFRRLVVTDPKLQPGGF